MPVKSFFVQFIAILFLFSGASAESRIVHDVVIFGGTPSGIIAAIAASRGKASVILVSEQRHLGGMMTSGLGATDTKDGSEIGGIAREFFTRVGVHYKKSVKARFEPRVAEKIFEEMLAEANVIVKRAVHLKSVSKKDTSIQSLVLEDGTEVFGQVFVDASYEGDLLALAGASYHVGRESSSQYRETLAGYRGDFEEQLKKAKVSAYDLEGNLLPGLRKVGGQKKGEGDNKVMAYNFRPCITKEPGKIVPITRPDDYDPSKYELVLRYMRALPVRKIDQIIYPGKISEDKYCINNRGPFSLNLVGRNYDYPEGDRETRARIIEEHKSYAKGFLYFLSSDLRVPERVRKSMQRFGLPKDEFIDNEHFPYEMYVREARRMIGDFIMTEKDLFTDTRKKDAVAFSIWYVESHPVERLVTDDGYVVNEGVLAVNAEKYQLPYRALLPKKKEVTNLLVPVALSASHVAYASIRVEPVFMTLGHAAGTAAVLAVSEEVSVQNVPVGELQSRLRAQEQRLIWKEQ